MSAKAQQQCTHADISLCCCGLCAVLQLMDRDPQMAQLLNNPELLRDSMNLISNPVSNAWHLAAR
jgi:hypothetical protein